MSAVIGDLALALALLFSLTLSLMPLLSSIQSRLGSAAAQHAKFMHTYSQSMAGGAMFFLGVSLLSLMFAFVTDDYSLQYVAANSGKELPLLFKATALWGAHEGSMLLWCLILSGWIFLFAALPLKDTRLHLITLALSAFLLTIFVCFVFFFSSPFESIFPPAAAGNYLNPLLQDPAFIIHPPLLYMGYAGLVVVCAIALAAALRNADPKQTARLLINWARNAWAFLTLGILLGSWWAYYELGWGGWWFWDPVENSSLLPWLVTAALVHSAIVMQKRKQLQNWVLFLALMSLSFCLMGIFLVRSGLLTSVHAFALDRQRGLFLLGIWFITTLLGCCVLWSRRYGKGEAIDPKSRSALMLGNNLLILSALVCVFVGTYYPLLAEWLYGRSLSVGAPYFSKVITPLALIGGVTASLIALFPWNKNNKRSQNKYAIARLSKETRRKYLVICGVLLLSLMISLAFPYLYAGARNVGVSLALFVAMLLLCGTLIETIRALRAGDASRRSLLRLWNLPLGHLGFILLIVGASLNGAYHQKARVLVAPGEQFTQFGYEWTLERIDSGRRDNYQYLRAHLIAKDARDGKQLIFAPARHLYDGRQQITAESSIQAGVFRDILVTLAPGFGTAVDDEYTLVLQWHPFVRSIWLGGLLIAIGAWSGWLSNLRLRKQVFAGKLGAMRGAAR